MVIVGIESTCDETGVAVVKNGRQIISNIVASSVEIHKKYGGVIPEIAAHKHLRKSHYLRLMRSLFPMVRALPVRFWWGLRQRRLWRLFGKNL